MPFIRPLLLAAGLLAIASGATAQTATAMSAPWAQAMCAAWNADDTLTGKLVASGWIKNDAGRGFKSMRIWRSDCASSERVEMRIALKDDKALCVFGGAAGPQPASQGSDYQMWADTGRWREMGAGEYGPMKAMMFGRLQFDGPKLEAMGNMGPFEHFLLLVGHVPGDWSSCP